MESAETGVTPLPSVSATPVPQPTAENKPRTFGEIRRKLRNLEAHWDKQRRHRAHQYRLLVEADRAKWAVEEGLTQLQAALAELGITLAAMTEGQ
jgi:hypothetical protein